MRIERFRDMEDENREIWRVRDVGGGKDRV